MYFAPKKDISYLKNLQCLECLHLEGIRSLEATTLCEILKRNRHMRDLNLACTWLLIHEVAMELKNSCPNLEKLNLKRCSFTSQSIYALADCKKLKEVNFSCCTILHYNYNNYDDNRKLFSKLFSSCQYLEKIDLSYFKPFNDRVLETLTSCKNLKILNLQCQHFMTPDICSQLFIKCPKLYEIDLSYCDRISESFIDQWNEMHNVIMYKYV
ncbi:PREDICTED: F-box/LRR-repeat protein 13-like [Wasmannia auropunctata]|uniref:F-box/LRR-repeat protein 13-like n=1 Tax=Wasmannia auropunctata TaxID=64793 RepID=UPI0005F0B5BB|nr:PREDICTED: F-box/LRR-repeat protein 13-like [Wasmannia auropunctata]